MELIETNNEMINHQTFIIKQLFNILDMQDVIIDLNKQTPYNLSNNHKIEYAPYDIILQEPCNYGNGCFYKKTPYVCPKNHQTNEIIIKKGRIIPNYLCRYERPWKNMRCTNMNCWFSHLLHHMHYVNYP